MPTIREVLVPVMYTAQQIPYQCPLNSLPRRPKIFSYPTYDLTILLGQNIVVAKSKNEASLCDDQPIDFLCCDYGKLLQ